MYKFIRASLCAMALAVASVYGDTFEYSYTLGHANAIFGAGHVGDVISGSFDGTLSGNFVDNISNITLAYNGTGIAGSYYTAQYSGLYSWVNGPIVSFDASQSNFGFFNGGNVIAGDYTDTSEFFLIGENSNGGIIAQHSSDPANRPAAVGGAFYDNNLLGGDNPLVDNNWKLTDVSNPSVPDGGATAAMLGSALIGLAAFRRRFVS
jgi:hypothetical protein